MMLLQVYHIVFARAVPARANRRLYRILFVYLPDGTVLAQAYHVVFISAMMRITHFGLDRAGPVKAALVVGLARPRSMFQKK